MIVWVCVVLACVCAHVCVCVCVCVCVHKHTSTHDCVRNILPRKWKPINNYVRVEITLCFKYRRGDLDNRVKAIFDALNGLVWVDDKQVDDFRVKRKVVGYDKTVVVVEEL